MGVRMREVGLAFPWQDQTTVLCFPCPPALPGGCHALPQPLSPPSIIYCGLFHLLLWTVLLLKRKCLDTVTPTLGSSACQVEVSHLLACGSVCPSPTLPHPGLMPRQSSSSPCSCAGLPVKFTFLEEALCSHPGSQQPSESVIDICHGTHCVLIEQEYNLSTTFFSMYLFK